MHRVVLTRPVPRQDHRTVVKRSLRNLLRATAMLVCALGAGASIAQYIALDPAFSTMYRIGSTPTLIQRDSARGWTYMATGVEYVPQGEATFEGVRPGGVFRVSDTGQPDLNWLPDALVRDVRFAADGTTYVETTDYATAPYTYRWFKVVPGELRAPRVAVAEADVPLRDHDWSRKRNADRPVLRVGLKDGGRLQLESSVDVQGQQRAQLQRIAANGTTSWQHDIEGFTYALAVDTSGNAYVGGGHLLIAGKQADAVRVLADGRVDTAWALTPSQHDEAITQIRVLGDRLVASFGDAQIGSFDLVTGATLTSRRVENYAYTFGSSIPDDGVLPAVRGDGLVRLLDMRAPDSSRDRTYPLNYGRKVPAVLQGVRWGTGYAIAGAFDYWLDGKRFRNLMRLDHDFKPDANWNPEVDGIVRALAVDTAGHLVVGGEFGIGAQRNLVRFSADGRLDGSWAPTVSGRVQVLHATSDGLLYVGGKFDSVAGQPRSSVARFDPYGSLDPAWAPRPWGPMVQGNEPGNAPGSYGGFGVDTLFELGANSVAIAWGYYRYGDMTNIYLGARVSRGGAGATIDSQLAWDPRTAAFDPVSGYVYVMRATDANKTQFKLTRLSGADLAADLQWGRDIAVYRPNNGGWPRYNGVLGFKDGFVYACMDDPKRFRLSDGTQDESWPGGRSWYATTPVTPAMPLLSIPCTPNLLPKMPEIGDRFVYWHHNLSPDRPATPVEAYLPYRNTEPFGPRLVYRSPRADLVTQREGPRTVIEYYSRDARRFFITSRPNEIALLDAMPASFARTGMQFAADEASVELFSVGAICRFYAAPAAGGSNTHFYGTETYGDCAQLKRYPQFKYEGFDFAVARPGLSGCASGFPNAVYRLFNQQSASNNGNHRYVVSDARRNEMIAAGWRDEGAVFCTSAVTDSRALPEVTR